MSGLPPDTGIPEWALAAMADGLADVESRVVQRPLTVWRAWHGRYTSQLMCLRDAAKLASRRIAFIGGNRSGKTEAAFRFVLHLGLGRDHPDTIEWARVNGVDISGWPVGPGRVYVVALEQNSSREYHRPLFAQENTGLPTRWHSEQGTGEARCYISVPGYKKPATFVFRSFQQGAKAFQGSAVRCIWMDEEEDDRDHVLAEEATVRLADQRGWLVRSMTPFIHGYSWAVPFFHEGQAKKKGWGVYRLFSEDNPFTNIEVIREVTELSPAMAAARERGEYVISEARQVYPYRQEVYVFDPETGRTLDGYPVPGRSAEELAPSWWSYRGIDFGTRSPTAIESAYVADDSVVVFAEHYLASPDSSEHIRGALAGDPPERWATSWGDPAAAAQRSDWGGAGYSIAVPGDDATKNIKHSVGFVSGLIKQRRLFISVRCAALIREMISYMWSERDDRPLDRQSDHACDALRYLVRGLLEHRVISPVASGKV